MPLAFNILFSFYLYEKKDDLFGKDKLLHIIHSAAIYGLSYHIYYCELRNDREGSIVFSISLTSLTGLSKEFYDLKKKSFFSYYDLIADAVGIGIGFLIFTGGFK
uniref:VanZ-like domain-containing protein n=1 Tax=candidate division WOR-3 bacterium TaxID=2052148 RepID=A0A7C4YGQ4_UNCW3